MRRPTFYRMLNPGEHQLVYSVFRDTLPFSKLIGIGDGLGIGDRPWTDWGSGYDSRMPDMQFQINVGDYASTDMSLKTWTPYDGDTSDLLIHEITEVIWSHGDKSRRKMSLAELKNTLYTPPPSPPNPTTIRL